ncbi:MAG: thioredoxin family protein [bacterium]|nr:thioredoxin family protein [bacterium]
MKHKQIGLAAIVTFFSLAFSFSNNGYEPGMEAVDFNLKNTNGQMVSMASQTEAKGFIIVFTCNECPFARKYENRIVALDKKYKPLGYPVIAINANDTVNYPEEVHKEKVKRAKDKGFTFPYLTDETQNIAKAFGAMKTPHIFLINKENDKFIVKYTGGIDNNFENVDKVTKKYLENALDELIAGKEITVKTSKAVGCMIKWVQ